VDADGKSLAGSTATFDSADEAQGAAEGVRDDVGQPLAAVA
jgi:hypothetical protein